MLLSSDSDDRPNRTLLEEAQKATRNSSGYHVEASGNTDTGSIVISGEIAGDNFDLTHVGQSLRFRAVRGNYWKSSDNGSTWSPTARDRGTYGLVNAPITRYAPPNSRVEVVEKENLTSGTLIWLQVRPDPAPPHLVPRLPLPRFGVVQLRNGGTLLQRFKGAVLFLGVPVFMDITYSKIGVVDPIIAPQ